MEEKFTLKQVLMMTCDMLRGIGSVPVEEAERIGVPVARAIRNLEECIRAMAETEHKKVEEKEDGDPDSE